MSAVSRDTKSLSFRSTTLMTSINLFSCLTICSIIRSSPEVTIVICDIEESSVGATERLSMLNPRPLKSPAIRDNTPNLFSTVTEIICSICEQCSGVCSLDQSTLNNHRPALPLCCQHGIFVFWYNLARAGLLHLQLRRIFENHLMVRATGWDHWIAVLVRMGRDINNHRFVDCHGFLQQIVEVADFVRAKPNRTVGFGELHEIRRRI